MYEYEIPKDFKTNRYNGKEKDKFFVEANKIYKTLPNAFVSDIKFIYVSKNPEDSKITENDEFDDYEQNDLCIEYKDAENKHKQPVFRFLQNSFTSAYRIWKERNPDYKRVRSIIDELTNVGFIKCKVGNDRCLVIEKTEFESLLNKNKDDILGVDV